jgi:predicted Fe-Mo cluster-binding NifX family protein
MKICFPVLSRNSLKSEVNSHFGSTKDFLVYDTADNSHIFLSNSDASHAHGQCQPLKALAGNKIDMAIVGGLGGGALMKLNDMGIRVFRATGLTVEANLESHEKGLLEEISLDGTCQEHHGCHKN